MQFITIPFIMLFKKKKKILQELDKWPVAKTVEHLQIHKRIHCTSIKHQKKIKFCYYFYDIQRKIIWRDIVITHTNEKKKKLTAIPCNPTLV